MSGPRLSRRPALLARSPEDERVSSVRELLDGLLAGREAAAVGRKALS